MIGRFGLLHEIDVLRSRLYFLVRDRKLSLALTFGAAEIALFVVNRFIKIVVLGLQLSPPLLAFTKAAPRVGATSGISTDGRGVVSGAWADVASCVARPR